MIFPYIGHPVILLNLTFFSLCLVVANYLLVSSLSQYRWLRAKLFQTTQSLSYLIVYRFSLTQAGLTFIGPLIGTWLAIVFSGYVADRYYIWASAGDTKRKPERRLPLLIPTSAIGVAGTILFGTCTQNQCHWIAPVIGSGALLFCFISAISTSFAYLLDIYEARTDSVMVIVNGIKNLAAFGISYAIIPWNTSAGYTIPFVAMAMIVLGAHLVMVVVYFRGERIRNWTAERFVTARETHHGDAF